MNLKRQLGANHVHAGTKKTHDKFKAKVDQEAEGCTILVGVNSNVKEMVNCFIRLKVRIKKYTFIIKCRFTRPIS